MRVKIWRASSTWPRRISQRGLCGIPNKRQEEEDSGQDGDTEFPAPLFGPETKRADDVVGQVGDQDSGHDIELKEADQSSALGGGRDFRDVHRADDGGSADGQPTDKAEPHERRPVPGEGASQGSNDIQDGEGLQALTAAVAIAGRGGEHGAEHGAQQGTGHREAQQHGREMVDLGKGAGGAGNHDRVEAEQEAAESSDDRAFEEISIHGLADAWYPAPRGKSNPGK